MSQSRKYRDRDIFYNEYITKNKSLSQLSDEWGNSTSTLHRWRKKHDIPKYRGFTDAQKEVIVGLLMGDGSINTSLNGNPRLEVGSITKEYLEYLDTHVFPVLGKNVRLLQTAKDSAESNRLTGFSPDADENNYSDIYMWYTESNPNLKPFADWYSSGKKVWPEDIELTPTTLKHWYCGDGNLQRNSEVRIYMSNERENPEKVSNYFEAAGLPTPTYREFDRAERLGGGANFYAQFTVEDSEEVWDYMGDPLPGFEYKWPTERLK